MTHDQRAHDIAISLVDRMMQISIDKVIKSENSDNSENVIDPYNIYKSLYDAILPLVEKDFPNDK